MARIKQRTQRIDLACLGEEWADGYIEAKRLHWSDLEAFNSLKGTDASNAQAEKALVDALQDAFVSGKAPDESGELMDLTKDDLKVFDIDAQTSIYEKVQGEVSPKG